MAISFTRGNLLEADVDALVNTVNTVGVMGKGIALQFKKAFPSNFAVYKDACDRKSFDVGQVLTTKIDELDGPKYIINFPTKQHWRGKSRMVFIEEGLSALRKEIQLLGIKSIAVPPLGCGLGGLPWPDVKRAIQSVFGDVEGVDILVFEPVGKPPAKLMTTASDKPSMTVGRAVLLQLMHRYTSPMLDPECTLLEVHKLTYFLQEAGLALRLEFVKGKYGPYAKNLRHVLNRLEGHYLLGFSDGSEEPGKALEPIGDAFEKASSFLASNNTQDDHFARVSELIQGFETPYGLELLGSVHWVAKNSDQPALSSDEAIAAVWNWNSRKSQAFSSAHIQIAWDRLTLFKWL